MAILLKSLNEKLGERGIDYNTTEEENDLLEQSMKPTNTESKSISVSFGNLDKNKIKEILKPKSFVAKTNNK